MGTTTYLRKQVRENFTVLRNSILRDPELSWKGTGFLAYLLGSADTWGLNFKDLQKRKKDKLSSTQAAAKELKQAGYLKINKIRNDKGRIIAHEWIVSDEPIFKNENPDVNNPDMENPHMDNPDMENQHQRNNNIKSTFCNKKQQQQNKPAPQGGGCGGVELIFDKAIDPKIHNDLRVILTGVDQDLAQQMLDALAQKIIWGNENSKLKVGSPLGLVEFFKSVKFDPTPGFAIAAARRNVNAVTVSNKAASEAAKDPVAARNGQLLIEKCRMRRRNGV